MKINLSRVPSDVDGASPAILGKMVLEDRYIDLKSAEHNGVPKHVTLYGTSRVMAAGGLKKHT